MPALGPRTPIATPRGFVPAASLGPGDIVLTRDAGPRPVVRILRHGGSGPGPFAPVHLRAPYFGLGTDLLVSGAQQIALSGIEVEYLFGVDEVLAEARHLADGTRARLSRQLTQMTWIALDLGTEALVLSGTCALAAAPFDAGTPRCATHLYRIDAHEARALQTMRLRGLNRSAA